MDIWNVAWTIGLIEAFGYAEKACVYLLLQKYLPPVTRSHFFKAIQLPHPLDLLYFLKDYKSIRGGIEDKLEN